MIRSNGSARRALRKSQPFVCWRCRQTRAISTTWLAKRAEAKAQWEEFAKEIRLNKRPSILRVLEERGFIHAIAGERNDFETLLVEKRVGVYAGVDPTAASLHVGHMIPIMALFWLYVHGVHCVTLLGSSTARIGDPSGRTADRPELTPTERKANTVSIHYQLKRMWANVDRVARTHGFVPEVHWHRELVNNNMWWNKLTLLEVLRVMGNGMRLGPMLSRDNVKTKLESGDGMSFAEFTYPLLQAWDWWHMYNTKDVQVQIGGSDQFGNIVSGIEAIKHIAKTHPDPDTRQAKGVTRWTMPFGFTVPLLTTSAGVKFGKSAGNAIWLDQELTSLFDLYGFFVRTSDADVERYLKIFTFCSLRGIQSLMDKHKQDPSKRIAQHYLAQQFIQLVHGDEAAKQAESQHRAVFRKATLSALTAAGSGPTTSPAQGIFSAPKPEKKLNPLHFAQDDYIRASADMTSSSLNPYAEASTAANSGAGMHTVLPKSLVYNQPIARVLYHAGLVASRSEGHRLAQNQGAYIGSRADERAQMGDDLNFTPAKLQDAMQTWRYVIRDDASRTGGEMLREGEEGLLILRVGKWKVRLCRVVSDEKFEAMQAAGEVPRDGPPGWSEWKAQQLAERNEREFLRDVPETEVHVSGREAKIAEREQRLRGKMYWRRLEGKGAAAGGDSPRRAGAGVGW